MTSIRKILSLLNPPDIPCACHGITIIRLRFRTCHLPSTCRMISNFLKYFCELCFPPEQESQDMQNAGIMRNEYTFKALFERFEKWLTIDPLEQDNQNP